MPSGPRSWKANTVHSLTDAEYTASSTDVLQTAVKIELSIQLPSKTGPIRKSALSSGSSTSDSFCHAV